jgi:hypothetical protein
MAKKIKKLVVNADRYEHLEAKSDILDSISADGVFTVSAETLKNFAKIAKAEAKVSNEEPEEFVESKHGGDEE